jgi:hypothetical protein
LFSGIAGMVNGFCGVAGVSCVVVQRDWLLGFGLKGGDFVWWFGGLGDGVCDIAGESCLGVQRDWLMGFVM